MVQKQTDCGRMMLTLLNKTRTLIFECNYDKDMWREAVLTAAYLTNRCPTKGVECTPYEIMRKGSKETQI